MVILLYAFLRRLHNRHRLSSMVPDMLNTGCTPTKTMVASARESLNNLFLHFDDEK